MVFETEVTEMSKSEWVENIEAEAENLAFAKKILSSIEQNLGSAIGYKGLLKAVQKNNELIENLDKTPVTTCYAMTVSAHVQALILALMRIWDKAGTDRLSMGRLDKMFLKDSQFLRDCVARAEKDWGGVRESNRQKAEELVLKMEEYLADDGLYKELREVRDATIAHTLDKKEVPELTFIRLFEVVDETVKIFTDMQLLVSGVSANYEFLEEDFDLASKRFWKMLSDGARIYDENKKKMIEDLYKGQIYAHSDI